MIASRQLRRPSSPRYRPSIATSRDSTSTSGRITSLRARQSRRLKASYARRTSSTFSADIGLVNHGLEVDDRRAVEGFQVAHPHPVAVDGEHLDLVEADRV